MGPKPGKETPASHGPLVEQFQSFGLSQSKAAEAAKTPKSAGILKILIEDPTYGLTGKTLEEKQAVLIAALAVQLSKTDLDLEERVYLIRAVESGRLKSVDQVAAAVKYARAHPAPIVDASFDQECGVGFSITPEALSSLVSDYMSKAADTISGWASLGKTIGGIKGDPGLRWADPLEIKNAVESAFTSRFGTKEAAKAVPKEPKKDVAKAKVSADEEPSADVLSDKVFTEGFLGALHKPGGNPQIKPELMEKHLAFTQSQVFTRFPPEPNGFLHIGHCKAIFIDFGYSKFHGGKTYLRYDDTNPEAEEGRYFESILETVRWLGFEPWKVTYSSDYFQQLYELAVDLIKRDKGYVCHCSDEELKANRGERKAAPVACSHRSRPVEESLAEFEKMKTGGYQPGQAILRMKQDLTDGNPYMWDLVAYRVLLAPHHRTGSKWRIYPTYDFTHCLVDSFENISHSLCSTEFIAARQSYEWLCDALEVYKPRQSEFGRLNITGTLMSKRKIKALVDEGHVRAWDDPRLYTLIALRRRGVPPGAILSFVSTLGVSTSPSTIQVTRFEQAVRQYLENTASRLLVILRPLKIVLENVPDDYVVMCDKPFHPKVPALGTSTVPFTKVLYIDRDDFRTEDAKDYFRLAPGKTVGLFQAPHPITCVSYKTDPASGEVTELVCRLEKEGAKKPKAYIQWVAEHKPSDSPVCVDEVRVFHPLFKSDNPAAVANFREDLSDLSEDIYRGALVDTGFWTLARKLYQDAVKESKIRTDAARKENPGASGDQRSADDDTPVATAEQLIGKEVVRFQGFRVAFFALDSDSKLGCLDPDSGEPRRHEGDYIVLNRIVSLKEDAGKATNT